MRIPAFVITLTFAALLANDAFADPDRDSLLSAWETHIADLPGTELFEKTGEDTYRYKDTDLPYDGELKLLGVLVRPSESATSGSTPPSPGGCRSERSCRVSAR